MKYELFISLRYLRAKGKNKFLSVITLISVGGVAVGVMTLIIVLAVMNGAESDLRDKILGTTTHIIISEEEEGITDYKKIISEIKDIEHIKGVAPFIFREGMVVSGKTTSGVVFKGIVAREEAKITNIAKNVVRGTFHFTKPNTLLMGIELAKKLGVALKDEITVIPPLLTATPGGRSPKFEKFAISGIFESGMYEYDSNLVYLSLKSAQGLFNLENTVTGIGIKLDDIYSAPYVSQKIKEKLIYPYSVRTWIEMNRTYFSALKLEKIMMFIILTLIVLVAAFNIASSLIMMVMEKTKEIGILKSIGATKKSIRTIFTLEGLIVGIMGVVLGCLGGFLSCKLLAKYQFIKLPSEIYYIDTLPVQMRGSDFFYVSFFAILISFLATIYPASQACRLNPVEAIRYE